MAYDLVVIGTGVAAQTAAYRVRAHGRSVAVIDHRPFGGTCALRGCDPKKVLVGIAEAVDASRRLSSSGIAGHLGIDWPPLAAFKASFTDPVPAARESAFAAEGIEAFHGRARFVGPNALAVEGRRIEGERILIASGARPAPLGFAGEEHLATAEDFLALKELPHRIVMVGGGYIAAEFSHIAARAGADVTVLQRGGRMLTGFDPELVDVLMEKFRAIGVNVETGTEVEAVGPGEKGFRVCARGRGRSVTLEADFVLHAAGRVPDIAELDLAAGAVAAENGRPRLNAFLQSVSNPAVYAAGDAAQAGPPLTPVAAHDGAVVADNIVFGNVRRPDYRAVPSVAFTLPPIAAVGLSEREAREGGIPVRVTSQRAADWYTARRVRESIYAFKTIIAEDSGRILGAHIVGPHAEDTINLFALAIRQGMTADDLRSMIFGYPTAASDISHML